MPNRLVCLRRTLFNAHAWQLSTLRGLLQVQNCVCEQRRKSTSSELQGSFKMWTDSCLTFMFAADFEVAGWPYAAVHHMWLPCRKRK